jgi:hypothetical protein
MEDSTGSAKEAGALGSTTKGYPNSPLDPPQGLEIWVATSPMLESYSNIRQCVDQLKEGSACLFTAETKRMVHGGIIHGAVVKIEGEFLMGELIPLLGETLYPMKMLNWLVLYRILGDLKWILAYESHQAGRPPYWLKVLKTDLGY